jgi:anti-sigma-K factor RskA
MSTSANITFSGPSGPRHPTPEDLVLYAMQLLNANESAAVSQHLASCPECKAELGRIHSDLALAASTVELEAPPESARQRLMQQVASEKKMAASSQPQAQPQAESHPPVPSFGRSGSILSIEDHPQKRNIGRTILGIAGWAVAAGLAIAAGLQYKDRQNLRETVTSQTALVQRLTADANNAHQLMDAITDPKAVRVAMSAKPLPKAPVGGVTYNPDKGTLVFLASNLSPLKTYKSYELWVIPASGTAPIPAGTFHPDDLGNASVIMPDLPKGVTAKAFAVTIEAEGGSQTPTFPIIMAGS